MIQVHYKRSDAEVTLNIPNDSYERLFQVVDKHMGFQTVGKDAKRFQLILQTCLSRLTRGARRT